MPKKDFRWFSPIKFDEQAAKILINTFRQGHVDVQGKCKCDDPEFYAFLRAFASASAPLLEPKKFLKFVVAFNSGDYQTSLVDSLLFSAISSFGLDSIITKETSRLGVSIPDHITPVHFISYTIEGI
jgi:hypothetical protein